MVTARKDLRLALTLALREARGGFHGFGIFLLCLALGIAAIGGIGILSESIKSGIARDGRIILGGDVHLRFTGRQANAEEVQLLAPYAEHISESIEFNSVIDVAQRMVPLPSEEAPPPALFEVKLVDRHYPLYGTVELASGADLQALLAESEGRYGAVLEQSALDRLNMQIGDRVLVNGREIEIRDVLLLEPDRLSSSNFLPLGPRLIAPFSAFTHPNSTTLDFETGSLHNSSYRLMLKPEWAGQEERVARDLRQQLSTSGGRVRSYENAANRLERHLENFRQFLTLVSLTALLIGGLGIANATRATLERRQSSIATLKSLGAPRPLIFRTYLILVLLMATCGIALGLITGGGLALAVGPSLGQMLQINLVPTFSPRLILIAIAFGFLIVLIFTWKVLAQARDVPAASLFRTAMPHQGRMSRQDSLILGLLIAALAALTLAAHEQRMLAFNFLLGAGLAWLLFNFLAQDMIWLAKRLPPPRRVIWRLARAALLRPDRAAAHMLVSLGLALTTLATLAMIEGNLTMRLNEAVDDKTPSFFFLDIGAGDVDDFEVRLREQHDAARLKTVPMLTGRITHINGDDAESRLVDRDKAWVLRGDRRLTYAAEPPDNPTLYGQFWPEDYSGAPLVSVADDVMDAFALKIGDQISFRILGREITAEVAHIRQVEWNTMRLAFAIVFSPGVLEAALPNHVGALYLDQLTEPERETLSANLLRLIPRDFPNIVAINISEALDRANELIARVSLAVRLAGSAALVAGLLVLAGAIAAGEAQRRREAVIYKVLGGQRMQIMAVLMGEYLLIGFLAAVMALALAALASYAVVTHVMGLPWHIQPIPALVILCIGLASTAILGFWGIWRALGQKAAPILRNA